MKHRNILLLSVSLALGLASLSIFSKQDSIRLLADDEKEIIHLGDKVTVEERKLVYNGQTKDVKGKIITPSGAAYSGREFTAKEHGNYEVVYEGYFGHHLEKRSVNYVCQRRSTDYFEVNESATLGYGEFRHNTNKFFHQGVAVEFKNGAEIKFNVPLDMNDFLIPQHIEPGKTYLDASTGKDANSLIDFIVDPEVQMTYDFTAILVKLTDVDNPDNFVEIRVKESGFTDPQAGALSYAKVGFSGGFAGGWEYNWQTGIPGDGKLGVSGTGIALSFQGQPYQDILHSGQFLLDYTNKRFYTYPGSLSHNQVFFINDLDEPNFYKNNGWKGFTSGKCYVSIMPYNFTNATGRMIIKSVGKYNFESYEMPDEQKPIINIDYQGYKRTALPKALVGSYYPVFNCSVSDNYDADLISDISVTYKDTVNNKNINITFEDNKFLVSKEGTYFINYTAKDRSGNIADTVSLRVDTVNEASPIEMTLPTNEMDCFVLDEITLPNIEDITTSGGLGNINISYQIVDPDNQVVELNGPYLKLEKVGQYHVVYTGTDYIGEQATKTLTINSQGLSEPKFVSSVSLPKAVIKGFTYELENVQAVETINNQLVNITPTIKVNGQTYNGSFIASGDQLVIEYIAQGSTGTKTETFTVPVIDVSDPTYFLDEAKYFYSDDISAVMNQDDVTLSLNNDASTLFINKLDAASFAVDITNIENYDNYEFIYFKLIDVDDIDKTATINIDVANKKVSVPGTNNLDYSLSQNNDQFSISYNDVNKKVFDTLGKELTTLSIDDNGKPFNGFKHGLYLEIGFTGVTGETKVKVNKINNQTLGYKEGSGDEGNPTIRLDSAFISNQIYGDNFFYPTFEAYDVLSEIDEAKITISKPDNTVISGNNHLDQVFTINAYGRYRVNYQASDKNGNISRINNVVFVYDDVAPTLSVGNLKKDKYRVGDAVELPTYVVSDNLDKYYLDIMLILPTNEMRILIHDENGEKTYALTDTSIYNKSFIINEHSFRTEMTGRHKLRYVAYDDEFNTIYLELTFYVE